LTVLEERAKNLEEENKSLLDRWMKRMKLDAEKMNEANEFWEQMNSRRMSSPITETPRTNEDTI